jgi:hypothetical protein
LLKAGKTALALGKDALKYFTDIKDNTFVSEASVDVDWVSSIVRI